MLETLLAEKTPTYPDANAVEIIKAVREQISESNNVAAHNLLTKTKELIGNQRIAINAHAELTSFVLAEQMSENLATEVATLNTTITNLNTNLFTTLDGEEYLTGPGGRLTGNLNGNVYGNHAGTIVVPGFSNPNNYLGPINNSGDADLIATQANSFYVVSSVEGQLDNVIIGSKKPLAGTFTDVTVNGSLTVAGVDLPTSLAAKADKDYVDTSVDTLNSAIDTAKEGLRVKRFVDNAAIGVVIGLSIDDGKLSIPQSTPQVLLDELEMDQATFVTNFVTDRKSILLCNTGYDGVWVFSSTNDVDSTYEFERRDDSNFSPSEEIQLGSAYPCTNIGTFIVSDVDTDNNTMTITLHTSTSNQISSTLQTEIDTLKSAVNAILSLMGEQSLDDDNNVVVGEVHPQV